MKNLYIYLYIHTPETKLSIRCVAISRRGKLFWLISPGKLSQIPPAESLLIYLIYLSRHLNQACWPLLMHSGWFKTGLLSMPMGVDYVVLGFDMEVQPLVTHNAA